MVICYKRFMVNVLLLFSLQADRVVIGGDHFFRCCKRLKLVLIFLSLSLSIFYFTLDFPNWISLFEGVVTGGDFKSQ